MGAFFCLSGGFWRRVEYHPGMESGGIDIDTRTDIYSLGVLLYELLTGVKPYDTEKIRNAGYSEIQRIIRP